VTAIPLVDLALEPAEVDAALAAMRRVMERGWFVLGPEVRAFEEELAAATDVAAAVGVASGTDAITLGLRALGIGPGDEVVVPAFTAFPTAVAVMEAGATPVLADVDADRPHLSLDAALAAITPRTKAVILVHLYGIAADVRPFADALADRGIHLVEDCAQAQGALLPDGRPVGSAGAFGILSFYPTKNLGALGDGGAVVTQDTALAAEVQAWRSHGERHERYRHDLPARNSRLDDIQAAVLRLRLAALPTHLDRTRALSARYAAGLAGVLPYAAHGAAGAPHLAVVRTGDPAALAADLAAHEIASGRHYPYPLGAQPALAEVPRAATPNAEAWAAECVSLPLHPRLAEADVDRVVSAVAAWADR
jgi:dTDP-3-amino-3,4,6-trideoxy-alpha-D-glucose transaminase